MNKKKYLFWAALLGVLIGVLGTIAVYRICNPYGSIITIGPPNNWSKLNTILSTVEKRYVDTIDYNAVTDAAVTAALAALDPHSTYFPPVEFEESQNTLSGNFDGIGIQFNVPNDTVIVLNVISGGPSEKIGLQTGDRIIEVDERNIAGVNMPQDSIVSMIKGPSGTKVSILVERDGELIPFDIIRDKIPENSIDAYFMINDTTGYVRLSKFAATTYNEFRTAMSDLKAEGMKRLIFDLRDNTGGYLNQAIYLANEFLNDGEMIVYTEGLHAAQDFHRADGKGSYKTMPITVLINELSASASEIFSGAMQDNDRAVIVGRRSFGKGLVQEPVYFNDGSGIRLTIARYYAPSGRCIQKPYDDYGTDIYARYLRGEMTSADSIVFDTSTEYYTSGDRVVYGGGGITPDIFVPVDTTRMTDFYADCNKAALPMRFASSIFDKNKARLSSINDYDELEVYLDGLDLKGQFLSYAAKQGIVPKEGEWDATEHYLMPVLRALVARYSKLGENAYYKIFMEIDEALQVAIATPSSLELLK